jgi:excisionase family DNA binding protein
VRNFPGFSESIDAEGDGFEMKLLTYKTAAEVLDCSASKVQKMVLAGEIPFIKVGNETRILPEDLEAWIRRGRQKNCRDSNTSEPLPTVESTYVK